MQKELFEKARQNLAYSQEDQSRGETDPCGDDDNILRVILGEENEERCIGEEMMSEAVNYVLRVPLEELRYFL